jgi:hypothetical protein
MMRMHVCMYPRQSQVSKVQVGKWRFCLLYFLERETNIEREIDGGNDRLAIRGEG